MIVVFQSRAAADVIMFGDVAHRLMGIMGKDADPKGIITVEQLPDAIARLLAAIAADKAERSGSAGDDPPDSGPDDGGQRISLTQRATPLLDMLEWARKKGKPVVWGV